MKRAMVLIAVFALAGCNGSNSFLGALTGTSPGTISVQSSSGQVLSTSPTSPYRSNGGNFTANEPSYTGSFSASVTSWNQALTPVPCYTIVPEGTSGFQIAEGGTVCVGGANPDIEGITFSDSDGNSTTQYFAPN